jgi:hypothetical protein
MSQTKRQWILLAAFTALIVILSFYHEMWRDEVRALSVAVDSPSWGAMFQNLHHEGHPSLWYVVLRAAYALSHSNLVLPIASVAIAVITAWVVLRYAPFPLWARALAVFGTFLGYELSVVARNYGIGVMLMIIACALFRKRDEHPTSLAVVLALLANTSVHATIAALVILALWLSDYLDSSRDRTAGALTGAAIVIGGIVIALLTARPSPDMAWNSGLASLDASKIMRSILLDPGRGLAGYRDANIAAAGEYPWRILGIDPGLASRLIVDAALAWLIWCLRKNWRAIAGIVVTICVFQVVFRTIYSASPRHEGLLLFLIISVCWMTADRAGGEDRIMARAAARGLLPLLLLQSLALPVIIHRIIAYRESSSKAYGRFIDENPRYRNAILVGDPDYFMEPMRYYVDNRVFMVRQAEFSNVTYFDDGGRRAVNLSLGQLQTIAQQLSCRHDVPVLVAIWTNQFQGQLGGSRRIAYGARLTWTTEERARFSQAARRVAVFAYATTDEVYEVYEISGCST